MLICHERWDVLNGVSWEAKAQYAYPNPSTAPRGHDLTPLGHWAVTKGKGKGKGYFPKGKDKGKSQSQASVRKGSDQDGLQD